MRAERASARAGMDAARPDGPPRAEDDEASVAMASAACAGHLPPDDVDRDLLRDFVGEAVVVSVQDDGRGLDRTRILARARERGLVSGGRDPSDDEVHDLVVLPGFSTAARITDLPGRGVGLDVVRRSVEALRGHVAIASEPGQGSTFAVRLPLRSPAPAACACTPGAAS